MEGGAANLNSLIETDLDQADIGVAGGRVLLAFVEAVVQGEPDAIIEARTTVTDQLGEPAMIDSAGVIANFQRMVRIADSTGIPLDEPVLMMTQGIRKDLGINDYSAAQNSPQLNPVKRIAGRLLGPFAPKILQRIAKRRAAP